MKDIEKNRKTHICPVEMAGILDNRIRRWFQDPQKILKPYIKEGLTVLDIGCGPGFFSIEMAKMVNKSGRVIAADLQEEMLLKLRDKIQGTELEERITLHKCEENKIGVSEAVDFVLAFYVVHELPDHEQFFKEIAATLKPNGLIFIAEPLFHVSKKAFERTIEQARIAGLTHVERAKVFLSRAMIMKKD